MNVMPPAKPTVKPQPEQKPVEQPAVVQPAPTVVQPAPAPAIPVRVVEDRKEVKFEPAKVTQPKPVAKPAAKPQPKPAVKPAAEKTSTGIIGILATAGTLKGEKYHNIKDRYAHDEQVVEHVGEGFVELVEANISSTAIPQAETEEIVRRSISPLISAGADHIVLGCTHYPFLESTIKKVASELSPERDITIVNPAPAVAKHLVEVMQKEGIKPLDSRAHILRSSDPERLNPTHNLFIAIVG
jgi:hypothetical protein